MFKKDVNSIIYLVKNLKELRHFGSIHDNLYQNISEFVKLSFLIFSSYCLVYFLGEKYCRHPYYYSNMSPGRSEVFNSLKNGAL